jgi:hypothetical protein
LPPRTADADFFNLIGLLLMLPARRSTSAAAAGDRNRESHRGELRQVCHRTRAGGILWGKSQAAGKELRERVKFLLMALAAMPSSPLRVEREAGIGIKQFGHARDFALNHARRRGVC